MLADALNEQPQWGVRLRRGVVTYFNDEPLVTWEQAVQAREKIQETTSEWGEIEKVYSVRAAMTERRLFVAANPWPLAAKAKAKGLPTRDRFFEADVATDKVYVVDVDELLRGLNLALFRATEGQT